MNKLGAYFGFPMGLIVWPAIVYVIVGIMVFLGFRGHPLPNLAIHIVLTMENYLGGIRKYNLLSGSDHVKPFHIFIVYQMVGAVILTMWVVVVSLFKPVRDFIQADMGEHYPLDKYLLRNALLAPSIVAFAFFSANAFPSGDHLGQVQRSLYSDSQISAVFYLCLWSASAVIFVELIPSVLLYMRRRNLRKIERRSD